MRITINLNQSLKKLAKYQIEASEIHKIKGGNSELSEEDIVIQEIIIT